jgi:stress response protein SCP2
MGLNLSVPQLTKAAPGEDGENDLGSITKVRVGCQWDDSTGGHGRIMGALARQKGTDLDLFGIACAGADPKRFAGLDSLDPFGNGKFISFGDALNGKATGDDEAVELDMLGIPSFITSIVYVASAFKKNQKFTAARNIEFNVWDAGTNTQVAQIWPSLLGNMNACAVARTVRKSLVPSDAAYNQWAIEILEEFGTIKQGDVESVMRFGAGFAKI